MNSEQIFSVIDYQNILLSPLPIYHLTDGTIFKLSIAVEFRIS